MTTPHFPIYLDYSSTNPCDPKVVDAMIPWLRETLATRPPAATPGAGRLKRPLKRRVFRWPI